MLRDDSGLLALTWYHQVAYFRTRYQVGQRCLVHGKVEGGPTAQKRMVHPEIDTSTDLEGQGILPVYNKPTTVSVGVMRKIVQQAAADWAERLPSVLPDTVVRAAAIIDLRQAMQLIHTPPRDADVDALNACRSLGHRSLVFDELFFLQLGMALRRRSVEIESGLSLPMRGTLDAPAGRGAAVSPDRRAAACARRDLCRHGQAAPAASPGARRRRQRQDHRRAVRGAGRDRERLPGGVHGADRAAGRAALQHAARFRQPARRRHRTADRHVDAGAAPRDPRSASSRATSSWSSARTR